MAGWQNRKGNSGCRNAFPLATIEPEGKAEGMIKVDAMHPEFPDALESGVLFV